MEIGVRNILVGSLLGDGWLTPLQSLERKTSSYRVKYHKKSLPYLQWIREHIGELQPSEIKTVERYAQHYFFTRSRTDIGELRQRFYPHEGIKRVPSNVSELLSHPLTLAIWYQDDGTLDYRLKYHRNAMFATHCFPYDDCVRLAKTLAQNFGIHVSVCKCQMRGKMYYRLYVLSQSMDRFVETIRSYIHPVYAYKIR